MKSVAMQELIFEQDLAGKVNLVGHIFQADKKLPASAYLLLLPHS